MHRSLNINNSNFRSPDGHPGKMRIKPTLQCMYHWLYTFWNWANRFIQRTFCESSVIWRHISTTLGRGEDRRRLGHMLRQNVLWTFRCYQISFHKKWIFRKICEYFFLIFRKILFRSWSNYIKIPCYPLFSSKINISSVKIWQLLNVCTAFFLCTAEHHRAERTEEVETDEVLSTHLSCACIQ